MNANTIGLTGSSDVVAFDGVDFVITMGSASCVTPTEICTYGGSQPLGSGTLSWNFQTPNTESITYDPFLGTVVGPTGGTFSVSDGVDGFAGTYSLSQWTYDGVPDTSGDDGIDLIGQITVTNLTLAGGEDPNQAAFESFFSLPASASYAFTLDVGDCTRGFKSGQCITPTDPSASFISLSLTPQGTPEPGTLGLGVAGLLAVAGLRRRLSNK